MGSRFDYRDANPARDKFNVRFGSLADVGERTENVCFAPNSRHSVRRYAELTEALDFAVARPWAKIIEMSACGALNAPAVAR